MSLRLHSDPPCPGSCWQVASTLPAKWPTVVQQWTIALDATKRSVIPFTALVALRYSSRMEHSSSVERCIWEEDSLTNCWISHFAMYVHLIIPCGLASKASRELAPDPQSSLIRVDKPCCSLVPERTADANLERSSAFVGIMRFQDSFNSALTRDA